MSHRIHPWKQLLVCLGLVIAFVGCHKAKPAKNPESVPPPEASVYEVLLSEHGVSYSGPALTSDLKTQDGTTIGNVEVGNDTGYLYLTYNLSGPWYLTVAQSYAGRESLIPHSANGNPNPDQFPGEKILSSCALIKKLTFKIPLSAIASDTGTQCPGSAQYFIAMKAMVRKIDNGDDCEEGYDEDAWAAPVLINPGNSDEWATAFYYCKQENTIPIDSIDTDPVAPVTWCTYGQGYWFAKPNVAWCNSALSFGNLEILKDSARALWPAKNNIVKKAFFQASALQLNRVCKNNNQSLPADIADDYEVLANFLSGLSLADIKNGNLPANADVDAIKAATGNIRNWICQHNCNPVEDPTACSEE